MGQNRNSILKKTSVIITSYNNGEFIEQCVKSVYSSFEQVYEIIVIDDGSTDDTESILNKLMVEIPIMKAFFLVHRGTVVARREGLKRANGEIITFVDGDDYIVEDYFGKDNLQQINENADVIIVKSYYKVFPDGTKDFITDNVETGDYNGESLKIIKNNLNNISPSLWLKFFRKQFIDYYINVVPEDILVSNDMAVSYPAILNANSIQVVDSCFYCYRISFYKKNVDRTDKIKSFLKTYKIINEYIAKDDEVAHKYRLKMLVRIIPLCKTYGFTKESYINLSRIGNNPLFVSFINDITYEEKRKSRYFIEILFLKYRLFFLLLLINKLSRMWKNRFE